MGDLVLLLLNVSPLFSPVNPLDFSGFSLSK